MGAKIHMHLEVKKDGRWLHFAVPHMYRGCQFFNLLAGIYSGEPIVPLRGLPSEVDGECMSEVTRFCYNQDRQGYRLHHEGYLLAEELVALQERLWDIFGDKGKDEHDLEFGYFHTCINGNTIAQHQGWDDVRLIFWFDN